MNQKKTNGGYLKMKPKKTNGVVKKKTPTYNFTKEQLDGYLDREIAKVREEFLAGMQRAYEEAIFEIALGIPALVLHDTFGFGRKRTKIFAMEVAKQLEFMYEDHFDINDLRTTIYEETGLSLQDDAISIATRAEVNRFKRTKREDPSITVSKFFNNDLEGVEELDVLNDLSEEPIYKPTVNTKGRLTL